MTRWLITYTNGESEYVDGYRLRVVDNVVRIRTTHDTAYDESWTCFPLAGLRSWRRV